jgi:von Willebrand factor type A domain
VLTMLLLGAAACVNGADVVFALDASGSIMYSNFQLMINFVATVAQLLDIDSSSNGPSISRVGLVTFGDNAQVQFNLNQYSTKSNLLQALNVPYAAGKSNTADAIR